MRLRLSVLVASAVAVVPLAVVAAPSVSHADTTTPLWLTTVNSYRAQAGLPAVSEDPALSAADALHVQYMIKTQTITHVEDPTSPYYTVDGAAAGLHSNLDEGPFRTQADAVDNWMRAPFHALGVLRPQVTQMGFAMATDAKGEVWAALDVLSDVTGSPTVTWPMTWPNSSGAVHTLAFIAETPNPLAYCPGYTAPAGLPLIVRLGPGASPPTNVSATLTTGGVALPTCELDENNVPAQTLPQTALAEDHSIIVIPQHPLSPLTTYSLHVDADGTPIDDSFTTDRGVSATNLQLLTSARYDGHGGYIGGFLTSDTGPLAGRTVQVLRGPDGAQTLATTATTKSDGSWVVAVYPEGTTRYVAQYTGSTTYAASRSPNSVTMRPAPIPDSLALVPTSTSVHRGTRVKMVAPLIDTLDNRRMPGFYVSLWAKRYGSTLWQKIATVKTDRYAHAIFYYTLYKTTYFQARFAGRTSPYPRYRAAASHAVLIHAT